MENRAGPSYGAELSKTTFCVGQSTSSGQVLGVATQVSTGLIQTILSDYLLLPLLFSLFLVFVFKSHILRWEEWLEERNREYQKFKSEKLLKWKIAQIKLKEKKGK
jgi:hypothetical protein